jgi:signal transduction histidine kinase/HAMP domain-containing protein
VANEEEIRIREAWSISLFLIPRSAFFIRPSSVFSILHSALRIPHLTEGTMKIRTQFIITMLLFGIILVVIAASAVITNQKVEKASEQEKIANDIAQGASELSYLANDYLVYRESQQLKRWQSRFALFSAQVAALSADTPDQQALIANIKANQNRLKEVFHSVASARPGGPRGRGTALDSAAHQVSWSRMAVQTQGLVSDASRLSQLLRQRMDRLIHTRSVLLYVIVGLFGLFLLVSYMLTYRRVLRSMSTLQAGAAIIGSGNLDFTMEERKRDEIGDLSRAFNRMTSDLKAVTASKTDLEREVTERKRAEEEVREARDRALWLARFPQENPNPVVRVSADGSVLYCNPPAAELQGWACAVGQPLNDRLLPLISRRTGESEESQQDIEIGQRFYSVWVTPFPGEGYANVYGRDITERKRAEEALRESEAKYRTLFENMAEEVHFWQLLRDEAGRIKTWRLVDANPPTLKTWGRSTVAEIRGKTTDEIFGPGATDHYMPVVQKIMTEGVPFSFEDYFPNLDKHFRFTSVPLGDYFITTGADITGIKKAEEALKKAHRELQDHAARLEAANKELESFTYSVSHDLRSPLRAIAGFTRMILNENGATFDPETQRKFGIVQDNALKMGRLIDDLLRLSRLGRAELSRSKLDMKGLVREVLQEIRTTEPERKFAAEIRDLPSAYGDLTMIRQLFVNLLSNAVKFTRGKEGARIEVGGFQQSGEQVYYVKDNGVGFDMKYYNKLFGVFQRLVTESQFEGTGVGLAIVQRIVQRHGGRVWAEGKLHEGATFYFTLP